MCAPGDVIWEIYIQGHQCLTAHVFHHQDGDSALMLAAREGRTEVVSLLVKAGANTDLQNKVKCRCDLEILCTQSLSVYHYTSHRMDSLH